VDHVLAQRAARKNEEAGVVGGCTRLRFGDGRLRSRELLVVKAA
jgi:hypothetical protein